MLWNILQEEHSDGAFIFNWMDLYYVLEWNEIVKFCDCVASKFGKTFLKIINRDNLLDEFCLIKYLSQFPWMTKEWYLWKDLNWNSNTFH